MLAWKDSRDCSRSLPWRGWSPSAETGRRENCFPRNIAPSGAPPIHRGRAECPPRAIAKGRELSEFSGSRKRRPARLARQAAQGRRHFFPPAEPVLNQQILSSPLV